MNERARRAAGLELARALYDDLRGLGEIRAPGGMLETVLREIGLHERYFSLESPIGTVYVAFSDGRISAVAPAPDDATFERAFRARYGRPARRATRPPEALLGAIREHLAGRPADLELDLRGLSEFERAVLLKAREIPRGEVRPYGWIAREIGRPGAVRAVGSALHKNPIPLLIPCHRVVRSDGQVGEYAFGPAAKRTMLTSEGLDLNWLTELAQRGVRYIGSPSGRYFCYPTCLWVEETDPPPPTFRTAAEALATGYHPCSDCRPATVAV